MDRIFKWTPSTNAEGRIWVGAFVELLSTGQPHCGLLRIEADGAGHILHLRDAVGLRDERARDGVVCIICPVPAIRAEAIAQRAQAIASADKNRPIRFGLSTPDQQWFSATGYAHYGNDHLGLTCSHFVVAFFRDAGLPLVQYETWPERPEDIEWQERIWRAVSAGETDLDKGALGRLEAMKKDIGRKRVRPLEVAGAALAEIQDLPVAFDTAIALASKVEGIVRGISATGRKPDYLMPPSLHLLYLG